MAGPGDKTAVVMIHGMGEQRPMETLRGFADAIWACDRNIIAADEATLFSKPDEISGGFELQRITTNPSEATGGRCDFFEYYWAHHMTGTRPRAMLDWLWGLLVRKPETVPERLIPHWRFGNKVIKGAVAAMIVGAIAGALALLILMSGALMHGEEWLAWAFAILALVAGLVVAAAIIITWNLPLLVSFVGDAARYFSPLPDNIAARNAIRQGGVEMIAKLHDRGYGRIIVAAHSLGTVVGYDILHHSWGRIPASELAALHSPGSPAAEALEKLEAASIALETAQSTQRPARRRDYRIAQRLYGEALGVERGEDPPLWRVTDFVTMGSPLSKADVLIAYQESEWAAAKGRRESPSCPPAPDQEDGGCSYAYPDTEIRVPHHASAFAPTVWTNIYFDNEEVWKGDVVAGEVAPRLGPGVLDIRLDRGTPLIRHTHYWSDAVPRLPARPWIKALRAAVNLRRVPEAALWGDADLEPVVDAERVPE